MSRHYITPHTLHSTTPLALVTTLYKHRNLLRNITRRDIAARYRGSALGMVWSFVVPLLMLGVYTLVFGVVFNARFGTEGSADDTTTFALTLFCGLMIHTLFSECLTRNPSIIMQHSNFVTKVVFPLELLPVMVLGSALFHFLMHLAVLLAGLWLSGHTLTWHAALAPLVLVPMLPLALGMGWILAALGVYIRDINQLTGLASTLLLFLSPIFYPADALPASFQPLLALNPLTHIIEAMRATMIHGTVPAWDILLYYFAISTSILMAGFYCFQTLRKGFADSI